MKTSELLKKLANLLINPDSEVLLSAEKNTESLAVVASALANAANELTIAAESLEAVEKQESNLIESIDGVETMAAIAEAFDSSEDAELKKVASVLDEILLTIGVNANEKNSFKKAEDAEIDRLREKYRNERGEEAYTIVKKEHDKDINAEEAIKIMDEKIKNYRPMEHALSTRYSPDMPGVSLIRIGDDVYQCPVTKKIYNYTAGYTTMDGDKVPGTNVSNQTQQLGFRQPEHANFSTRESVLNGQ
jgi:hypothetical protein